MKCLSCLLTLALLVSLTGCATRDETASAALNEVGPASTGVTTVGVDPQADELLRAMSDFVTSTEDFRFETDEVFDDVLETGERVQFSSHRVVIVSRPDRLHVVTQSDLGNRSLWKDGETVTILERTANVYGQLQDPGTIDDMMDMLWHDYGISVPLADLISADPYGVLMSGVRSGRYLGVHLVDGVPSHHLVFSGDEIDFQVWIREESNPVPTKLLISYKNRPGVPGYATYIRAGERLEDLTDANFQFEAPADAELIDILPLDALVDEMDEG